MAQDAHYISNYPGHYTSEQDFAILIDELAQHVSGPLIGCGVSVPSGRTVHIEPGWMLVRGRLIRIGAWDLEIHNLSVGTTFYILAQVIIYASEGMLKDSNGVTVMYALSVPSDKEGYNVSGSSGGTAYGVIATMRETSDGPVVVSQTTVSSLIKESINS